MSWLLWHHPCLLIFWHLVPNKLRHDTSMSFDVNVMTLVSLYFDSLSQTPVPRHSGAEQSQMWRECPALLPAPRAETTEMGSLWLQTSHSSACSTTILLQYFPSLSTWSLMMIHHSFSATSSSSSSAAASQTSLLAVISSQHSTTCCSTFLLLKNFLIISWKHQHVRQCWRVLCISPSHLHVFVLARMYQRIGEETEG